MNYCMAISGAQGSGKTTFAKKIFFATRGKKIFIAPDIYDPSISDIPVANKTQFGKITFDKKIIPALIEFRDGLIVFDDARFYFDKHRDENFRKILIRRRQYNRNIVFICHSVNEIPPSYFYFFTHIVIFKGHLSEHNLKRLPLSPINRTAILTAQDKANSTGNPVMVRL